MNRNELINALKTDENWDIVVIGGGASGLGAALEAVTRGYKTLLLEQYDYTIGTSSRSTKLVHGGVRYLAQGDIQLVLEALKERGLLLKNAPHLVKNQTFLIPSYNWWTKPFYTIGLSVYNMLSGKLTFGPSRPYSRSKSILKMPTLVKKKFRGGVVYHDGQFDDSRLGINLVQTIIDHGGTALNYARVDSFLKDNGEISGVVVSDLESGEKYNVKAKAVLNATGVFTDEIMHKDSDKADVMVQPSQGVHLVIDQTFLQSDFALMIPKTSDGRVLFAVPWYNRVILGTTDIPVKEASIEPYATEEEIDFILETAGRYLEKKPTLADIKSVFAGLRPLAAPKNEGGKTKEISRRHKIVVSDSGLVSIIGGKWTIYREMGEDAVDKLCAVANLPKKESKTKDLHLHGYMESYSGQDSLKIYGSDLEEIEKLIKERPELGDWLSEDLKIKKAQIVWSVRNEYARKVEDALSRRARALILDAEESIRIAPEVADIMAKELGRNEEWKQKEIKEFIDLANKYLIK